MYLLGRFPIPLPPLPPHQPSPRLVGVRMEVNINGLKKALYGVVPDEALGWCNHEYNVGCNHDYFNIINRMFVAVENLILF